MPRKKWIDKKSATTFALVHRSQNDPRIHDAEASSMVFKEVAVPNQKIKTIGDLEEELELDPSSVRENEGEAALHGVFYDDTNYDYMQHMRDLGDSSEGRFVEANSQQDVQTKMKGKQKRKLEDALREIHLDGEASNAEGERDTNPKAMLDTDFLPLKSVRKINYQEQQDVPDALAGLQPDMDPRLREVLEALEDEAYVDDEDDIFAQLGNETEEISFEEFEKISHRQEAQDDMDLDDGWETDDTAKPSKNYRGAVTGETGAADILKGSLSGEANKDWMAEFGKFKKAGDTRRSRAPVSNSDLLPSSIITASSSITSGKHKKRKGAMTSSTGYSMTSSSLFRTEGLTLLDDRFDKIEREYTEEDGDEGSSIAGMSTISQGPVRSDFDTMMDDFLGNYSMSGKKRVKRGGPQSGLAQLDEIVRNYLKTTRGRALRDELRWVLTSFHSL